MDQLADENEEIKSRLGATQENATEKIKESEDNLATKAQEVELHVQQLQKARSETEKAESRTKAISEELEKEQAKLKESQAKVSEV